MNRAALLEHLEDAKRRAAVGQCLIDAQRRIIASLTDAGLEVTAAEKTLAAFDRAQELRLAEIEVVLGELDKIPLVESSR